MPDPDETTLRTFREMMITTDAFGEAKSIDYRLMSPEADRPGEKYPLVLFLHGAGERGSDNVKQLLYLPEVLSREENRERYACYALVPQCPDNRRWVEVPWDAVETTPQGDASPAMRLVLEMLDEVLHAWPIDPQRVYLTGMSMGGYGAWDLASRRPATFAALAPLCGGGDEAQAGKFKSLPIWAVHGEKDAAVPAVRSRRMIEAVRHAGGKPKYSELPGVGHNCWSQAYAPEFGLLDWMFRQRREA